MIIFGGERQIKPLNIIEFSLSHLLQIIWNEKNNLFFYVYYRLTPESPSTQQWERRPPIGQELESPEGSPHTHGNSPKGGRGTMNETLPIGALSLCWKNEVCFFSCVKEWRKQLVVKLVFVENFSYIKY